MSLEAKNPALKEVRSHWIETEHGRGGELAKEELYPQCTAEWRGKEFEFTIQARRYRYSGDAGPGWTDWMVSYYHGPERLSGTARSALGRAATPLVEAWLASTEYKPSRERAVFFMLKRLIQDERTGASGPARELQRHGHELTAADEQVLTEAVYHLTQLLALLDTGSRA